MALIGALLVAAVSVLGPIASADARPVQVRAAASPGPCDDPTAGECTIDPKSNCPILGPLGTTAGHCEPLPGALKTVVTQEPGGGCVSNDYVVIQVPRGISSYEAVWYSNIGEGTRWWQSPGTVWPHSVTGEGASYKVPKGHAAWSGAGGASAGGNCPAGPPAGTAGVRGWGILKCCEVSGKVTRRGSGGQPAPNIRVQAACAGGRKTTLTGGGGGYLFVVNRGPCTISPLVPSWATSSPKQRSLNVRQDIRRVDFQVDYPLNVSYQMGRRLVRGPDGLIEYPGSLYQPELAPPFIVGLKKKDGSRCDSSQSYTFRLGARVWPAKPGPKPCEFTLVAPQDTYRLSVTGGPYHGLDKHVKVRSLLIFGLGDSVASGEGNPDIPATNGGTPHWEFGRCDRSANSFEAQSAIKLEQRALPRASVTFIHLACSGAGIDTGVNGAYFGQVPGSATLSLNSQVTDVQTILGQWKHKPDGVLVSIGANDIKFGDIVSDCAMNSDCPDMKFGNQTLRQIVTGNVARLPAKYSNMAARLAAVGVPHNRVYITQYYDPTDDSAGAPCARSLGVMGPVDNQWAYTGVVVPLNRQVNAAAKAHGWNLVGGAPQLFRDHGYCAGGGGYRFNSYNFNFDPGTESSGQSWIVHIYSSFLHQHDQNGTMHPDYFGHKAIAGLVLKQLQRDLLPNGKPRSLK